MTEYGIDYDCLDVGDDGFDTPEYRDHATARAKENESLGLKLMAQHWRDARALSWDKQHGTHTFGKWSC